MAIGLIAHTISGAVTTTTTPAINCAGANLIVAVCADYGVSAAGGSMTDSSGNTYTAVADSTTGNDHVCIWYAANPTVTSSQTFTKTGSYPRLLVLAFSGAALTSTLDQHAQGAGSTTMSAGTINPAAGAVTVAAAASATSSVTFGLTDGNANLTYFITDQHAITSGVSEGSAAGYALVGGVNTNPTWTLAGASGACAVASFKAAAAAAGIFGQTSLDGLSTSGPKQFKRLQ
jgi:hypothetical protein